MLSLLTKTFIKTFNFRLLQSTSFPVVFNLTQSDWKFGSMQKMGSSNVRDNEMLLLFDVDGTLTLPRQIIKQEFYNFLINEVKPKVKVGIVGGSDLVKIIEQLGVGDKALKDFDYVFAENGLIAYKEGSIIGKQSIHNHIGEEKLQEFLNYCMGYMSKLKLPCKRGTFIEFRAGMINVCPVGRSCSQEERLQFSEYDKEHNIRQKMTEDLRAQFPDLGLHFAIGGQISIDAFPHGWDKTFSLNFLQHIPQIHFFGDKTSPGGNDYEIFSDSRTIGHVVSSPEDTEKQVKELLGLL